MVMEEVGRPLVRFPAHEAVELLEAHAAGPLVERPGGAVLERRRVVVLAEPRGRIAIVRRDAADRRAVRADHRTALTEPGVFPEVLKVDLDCLLQHLGRTAAQATTTVVPVGPRVGSPQSQWTRKDLALRDQAR